MRTAYQSDSSFVKRHEEIASMVWADQSDRISVVDCLITSAFHDPDPNSIPSETSIRTYARTRVRPAL